MKVQELFEKAELTLGNYLDEVYQDKNSDLFYNTFMDPASAAEYKETKIWKRMTGPFPFLHAKNCGLSSFDGGPEKTYLAGMNVSNNWLSNFEGCPEHIDGDFILRFNYFKSLKNIHKHLKVVNGRIDLKNNQLLSDILGLLKIKRLQKVNLDNKNIEDIINKYLPEGDILECQQELIDAGFEEYARL